MSGATVVQHLLKVSGSEKCYGGKQLFLLAVRFTVKVKFTTEQATTAERGSRGILLLFL
jgi:hypothetical protein